MTPLLALCGGYLPERKIRDVENRLAENLAGKDLRKRKLLNNQKNPEFQSN